MKKILLIEDDASIAEVITVILSECGYQITHDASGETIQKPSLKIAYDLILLDYLLPNTTGAELIIKLKKMKAFENTPVILMSANTVGELSRIANEVQANGYLAKPFDIQLLKQTVQKILND